MCVTPPHFSYLSTVPSCPRKLLPNAKTFPSPVKTRECSPPAATAAADPPPYEAAGITAGTIFANMVPAFLLSPSWPYRLEPQESSAPSVAIARAWYHPTASEDTTRPFPRSTGADPLPCVLRPSCPYTLYPKEKTRPSAMMKVVYLFRVREIRCLVLGVPGFKGDGI